ncbi:FCD domain-containing protein [Streptomyces sp. NPDC046805]|uniref:FCD domain-containing protein n=1 Tax=Streptomyces sp. NPDC046805 TaxID=3155134 RepID=UPI0033EA2259
MADVGGDHSRRDDTSPEQVIAEHGRIYEALRHRDGYEAQMAILEHIAANERRLLGLVCHRADHPRRDRRGHEPLPHL